MSLGSGVFQTLMRCTLRRQPPRIKRMRIRFSLTPYLSGKIAFSRQQRLIYFQYPLHRFFDQSHTSVAPLSSGGFNTSPIRLRFFSFFGFCGAERSSVPNFIG